MAQRSVVYCEGDRRLRRWSATTLDQLGKDERFLEDVLAGAPELLGLETRRTGIRGPFAVFQQVSLRTPSGRTIHPDIVLLASSGHVIVAEVKRYVNPELRSRAVIAQIIDYASSFTSLTESRCVEVFGDKSDASWADLVERHFPGDPSIDELAQALLDRMRGGEVNLVIACDKVPTGLPEVVSGIVAQKSLGFELDLVEVVPYVEAASEGSAILFVPTLRMSTEIVARTAVTITYKEGDARPSADVQVTSAEEIEQNVRIARSSGVAGEKRSWTANEVDAEFARQSDPTALSLLGFVKEHGAPGSYIDDRPDCVRTGPRAFAKFSFFVRAKGADGTLSERPKLFSCIAESSEVRYILEYWGIARVGTEHDCRNLLDRLRKTLGEEIDLDKRSGFATLDPESLASSLADFKQIMLDCKRIAESSPSSQRGSDGSSVMP